MMRAAKISMWFGAVASVGGLVLSFAALPSDYNLVTSFSYPQGNILRNGSFENNYTDFQFEGRRGGLDSTRDLTAYLPLPVEDTLTPFNGRKMVGIQFSVPSVPRPFLVSDPFPIKPG